MDRRQYLGLSFAQLTPLLIPGNGYSWSAVQNATKEAHADIVIVGGSVGGVAAALAACRNQLKVILTEETRWIGGQLTSQAVPPDEHPWIEQFGCTRNYRQFRDDVRAYYRRHYPLTEAARANRYLNPGNANVSRLCHEPRVALAVLLASLAPYVSSGQLTLLTEHRPIRAEVDRDQVKSVQLLNQQTGKEIGVTAKYFVDATELGELLSLSKTESVIGFESQKQTSEPSAPAKAEPLNQQAITFCFALDYRQNENHTIEKPEQYAFWRDYIPQLKPSWPGKLLSWEMSEPVRLNKRQVSFSPTTAGTGLNLWHYRRLIDRSQFTEGSYASDITLVNWPQNDYWLGPIVGVSDAEKKKHLEGAKQLSKSLIYWLQTEAPREGDKQGWPGLKLRGDIVGSEDGLALYPYIRESRRIVAKFTILEQHVSTAIRQKEIPKGQALRAVSFADSVGIGSYRIDLHPSTAGNNYIDVSSLPFQIPLGALIPIRVKNLFPACKNIGTTHITNGCYRLHPVEWNIGEAVGLLLAYSIKQKQIPQGISEKPPLLKMFQQFLIRNGIELRWPEITPR